MSPLEFEITRVDCICFSAIIAKEKNLPYILYISFTVILFSVVFFFFLHLFRFILSSGVILRFVVIQKSNVDLTEVISSFKMMCL